MSWPYKIIKYRESHMCGKCHNTYLTNDICFLSENLKIYGKASRPQFPRHLSSPRVAINDYNFQKRINRKEISYTFLVDALFLVLS